MLFKERILSLLIFVIILFIVLLCLKTFKRKYINVILKIYILFLSIMGYLYKPLGGLEGGADLNRIFYILNFYSFKNLKELYMGIISTTNPGVSIYYYLINKFDNKNLLPATTALIAFSFWFGIIKLIVKNDKKVRNTEVIISILLFMSRGLFLQTISNIRTLLGISILTWCIYQEFYGEKKIIKVLPYYVLGASFHSIVQVIFLYRISYHLLKKLNNRKTRPKVLLWIVVIGILFYFWGKRYILKIVLKAQSYIEASVVGTNYFYVWEYILSMLSVLMIVYLIYIFKKSYKNISLDDKKDKYYMATIKLIDYIIPLLYFCIFISFIEFNTFMRLSWYLNGIAIPLSIYIIRDRKKNNIKLKNLIILSMTMLFISCARGDLCGLNFFDKF